MRVIAAPQWKRCLVEDGKGGVVVEYQWARIAFYSYDDNHEVETDNMPDLNFSGDEEQWKRISQFM